MPVDKFNNPLPWFTYSAISFIEKKLLKSFNVFECGAGNSTKWFAKRVNSIISVEHDRKFFNYIYGDKTQTFQEILLF